MAQLRRALLSEIGVVKDSKLLCKLEVTVKTHKDPGKVSMRAIHSCSTSPIALAYKWLSHMLKPTLKAMSR